MASLLASKIRSGVAFSILFPLLLLVLLIGLAFIPTLGQLAYAGLFFSAPGMWILASAGISSSSPSLKALAGLGHLPVAGFLVGYIWPMEFDLSISTFKALSIRFGLFAAVLLALGAVLFLYAVAHDS